MNFKYRITTFPAPNKKNNEDAVGVFELNDGLLIIVSDAIGGNPISYRASQICVNSVYEFFKNSHELEYLAKARESINAANQELISFSSNNHLKIPLTTTVDILFLKSDYAYWGHIGDSRIYNFKNNILHRITKDHSVVQRLVDEGFITMREASNHSGKGIIFGAVGAGDRINIDVSKIQLNTSEKYRFFICTDGVTGIITDAELENFLRNEDLDKAKNAIQNLLLNRNHKDDCTYVMVDLVNS